MEGNLVQGIIEKAPVGFARADIIRNEEGTSPGFRWAEQNPAFRNFFGAEPDLDLAVHMEELSSSPGGASWVYRHEATGGFYKINGILPEAERIFVWATDVTLEMNRLMELERMDKAYSNVIDGSNLGTWELNIQTGEQTINDRWAEMIGYTIQELEPITINTWLGLMHPDDRLRIQPDVDYAFIKGHGHYSIEFRMRHKDGRWIWINSLGKVNTWTRDDKPLLTSGTHLDITAIKEAQQELEYLSYHDQLTGLYNRRFYEEELKRLDTERNLPIALIMADVNGLKLINDAFGHQEGDQLLTAIAKVLKKSCRSDEIIARIGGDEFVVLLPRTTAEEARMLIGRIHDNARKATKKNRIASLSLGYGVKAEADEKMEEVFMKAEDDMYRHKIAESSSMRSKTIDLIMNSLFEKSSREMLHSKRVGALCEAIARHMYFPNEEIRQIGIAGLVHDIGKIGIHNLILDKEGTLTQEEYEEIKKHSEIGYRILGSVSEFSEIAQYVFSHQERWDGEGYPRGLKGDEIPIQSRIIAVADAFDAMTTDRTYRRGMSQEEALMEIALCAGRQFDPDVVKVFMDKVCKNHRNSG